MWLIRAQVSVSGLSLVKYLLNNFGKDFVSGLFSFLRDNAAESRRRRRPVMICMVHPGVVFLFSSGTIDESATDFHAFSCASDTCRNLPFVVSFDIPFRGIYIFPRALNSADNTASSTLAENASRPANESRAVQQGVSRTWLSDPERSPIDLSDRGASLIYGVCIYVQCATT